MLQGYPKYYTLIGEEEEIEVKDYQYDSETRELPDGGYEDVEKKVCVGTHKEKQWVYTTTDGKKKKVTDSERYKALGNSIATGPNSFWKFLLKRIIAQYDYDPTMASLFDGIGGFPLLWEQLSGTGKTLWASEIEEFPIAVTKQHFPYMKHYGDITKINGAEVPVVDCIIGGSPCQDLSVAGKRAGMQHSELGDEETTRSGLFMEQIRIIKEMRANDMERGRTGEFIRPRYAVWENVPGAFSSNKGQDFKAVLEEFCKVTGGASLYLNLQSGQTAELSWEMDSPLLGQFTMQKIGAFPKEEREYRLSQILVDNPLPKYFLSARACQGIINRAENRGKELPKELEIALRNTISKA